MLNSFSITAATWLALLFTSVLAMPAKDEKSILFYKPLIGEEEKIARSNAQGLGFTTVILNDAQWAALKPDDVKTYRAIVFGDPNGSNPSILSVPETNRDIWSLAITGNIIIMGTDTGDHMLAGQAGAKTLMENGIRFAAADVDPSDPKKFKTGLYLALSEYYALAPETSLPIMDKIAAIRVEGVKGGCYDDIHIVADSPALSTLDDAALDNWSCSVHEVITEYPLDKFAALAIAENVSGKGSVKFGDNTFGIPYIIARGVTPVNCGNGKLDPGEDCDDGNKVDTDACPNTCKKVIDDPPPGGSVCSFCNPAPGLNLCDPTAPCSNTPYGTQCVCRPGYRADAPGNDNKKHWRLNWPVPGHEHRVYVPPKTVCNTLCDQWYMGATGCLEVAVATC